MTKVDFYILGDDSIEQRHIFACRLVEKAFKLGHHIYIHNDDDAQANTVDRLLWQWRNSSFLPHTLNSDENASTHAIQVGFGDTPNSSSHNLLLNLSHSVPDFFSRFERVVEVVVQVPSITEATRANYRFYRDRGYQLENHDLRKSWPTKQLSKLCPWRFDLYFTNSSAIYHDQEYGNCRKHIMNDNNDNLSPSPKTAILDELESIKGVLDDSFDDDDDLSIDIPILEDVVQHADDSSATSLLDLDQIFEEDSIADGVSEPAEPVETTSLEENTHLESISDIIDTEFSDDEFTALELDNLEFDDLATDIEIPSFKLNNQSEDKTEDKLDTNTVVAITDNAAIEYETVLDESIEPETPLESFSEEEQEDMFVDVEPTELVTDSSDSDEEEPDMEFLIQDIVDEMIPQIEDELRRRLSTYSSSVIKELAKKHLWN